MPQQSHLAPLSQRPYVASLKCLPQELTSGVTSWSLSLELAALSLALRLTVPAPRRTPRLTADNRKPPESSSEGFPSPPSHTTVRAVRHTAVELSRV